MRIGLLTGGGDCPGLNAAIRAVSRVTRDSHDELIGYRHGWLGFAEGEGSALTPRQTKGILQTGGTILGTARYHPDEHEGAVAKVLSTVERDNIDALIVIGGDGTLGSANHLVDFGLSIVGIPKTIDNDVMGTQRCIGFDTAVATAAEAIDRVHTTGESHDRLMVVEVMGRTTGWLALSSGIASGADAICVPEQPTDLDLLAKALQRRHDDGSTSSIVVVAEGATFLGLERRIGETPGGLVTRELEERTGFEARLTVLGHIQRGGPPTATDRLLAENLGVVAIDAVRDGNFNTLVAVQNDVTVLEPLAVVAGGARPVPEQLLELARQLTVL